VGLRGDAAETVLYLIDARTVLHPPTEAAVASELALGVDWSSAGIFDDTRRPSPELASPIEPKLNEVDISNVSFRPIALTPDPATRRARKRPASRHARRRVDHRRAECGAGCPPTRAGRGVE
jgi:hypothetical protein